MRLKDIMTDRVVTIGPDEPADAAWSRMQRDRIRHLVVVEGRRLVGVISERDLGGPAGGNVRRGRYVRDLMAQNVATADPDTTLREAANLMRGRLIGSLPVLRKGRVAGIVTATDVLDALGRGFTRPVSAATRRPVRMPPAAARSAARRTRGRGGQGRRQPRA
ncbi:MAG TPA: CBS domain-containing protein [Burkholderiales bacterium]|nr:CBS domain-containing protein [Burkholderiales bacterium]